MRQKEKCILSYGLGTGICYDILYMVASRRQALIDHLGGRGYRGDLLVGRIILRTPRPWYEVTKALEGFDGISVQVTSVLPTNGREPSPGGRPLGKRLIIYANGLNRWCA